MLKLLIVVILMMIGNLWVAGMSCNSCGAECASSCGTRKFRTCCFNYLRRKRGSEIIEMPSNSLLEDVEDYKYPPQIPEDLEMWWNRMLSNGRSKFDLDN